MTLPAGGRRRSSRSPGKPLAAYQVGRLVNGGRDARDLRGARPTRERLFVEELSGLGAEIVAVEEPERLGRGGGIKFAARERRESGDVYALNGDELVDVDFAALLARAPRDRGGRDDRRRAARSRSSGSSTWTTTTSCAASRRPASCRTG